MRLAVTLPLPVQEIPAPSLDLDVPEKVKRVGVALALPQGYPRSYSRPQAYPRFYPRFYPRLYPRCTSGGRREG